MVFFTGKIGEIARRAGAPAMAVFAFTGGCATVPSVIAPIELVRELPSLEVRLKNARTLADYVWEHGRGGILDGKIYDLDVKEGTISLNSNIRRSGGDWDMYMFADSKSLTAHFGQDFHAYDPLNPDSYEICDVKISDTEERPCNEEELLWVDDLTNQFLRYYKRVHN